MKPITRKLLRLKHLPSDYRKELIYDLNYEKYQRKYRTDKCPICGSELYTNSWSEDHWGVVETIVRCGWIYSDNMHYLDHTSYGYTDLIAGGYEFGYDYTTPWQEVDRIRNEWMQTILKIKKERKKIKALSYRKKKSQQRRTSND